MASYPRISIGSLDDFRELVSGTLGPVELGFFVDEDTPLDKARDLWRVVSQDGGQGTMANLAMLVAKLEAREFVRQKLRQLERWRANVEMKVGTVDGKLEKLQDVLDEGGPALLADYEPLVFDGARPYLDSDQDVKDSDLEEHIEMMKALFLDEVGRTPGPEDEGTYSSAAACQQRQLNEQEAITELKLAFLQLKRHCMDNLSQNIKDGIESLATQFLSKPTNLGCSTANFVGFEDVAMYNGELRGL